MPDRPSFEKPEGYYSTLFHELGHSTGHATRLARKGIADTVAAFGSDTYGREELVAEMTSAFLCGHTGIEPATLENSAAYVAGWLKVIRQDARLVVTAAAQAQKAADYILGRTWNDAARRIRRRIRGRGCPMRLAEKYRPQHLADVVGQPCIRKLQRFAKEPFATCWLFQGDPGTGKSATALALAAELGAVDAFSGLEVICTANMGKAEAEAAVKRLHLRCSRASGTCSSSKS